MANNDVDNFFQQPEGGGTDNKLEIGGSMETSTGVNLATQYISIRIDDVSTAGSIFVSVARAGSLIRFSTSLDAPITGGDATITAEIGGILVTGSATVITQSGSASGDVDISSITATNSFTAAQSIEIITDGGSTGTVPVIVTLEVQFD